MGPKWTPNRHKMAPKDPNMAPKGSPRYFIFVVSANVKKFGGFRPFWVRKTSEIGHKMASIASYWAPKCTQFCPEWPQNDSQMTPTVLYGCGPVLLVII